MRLTIAASVMVVTVVAAPVRAAEDDKALQEKALRLNQVTGNSAMSGSIRELLNDKKDGKKIVATAARLLKDKPQSFTFNALLILARSAQGQKDYDACIAFYRAYIADANKLRSGQKVVMGYEGIIQALFAAKKFPECEKECRRFMELDDFDDPDLLEENPDKQRQHTSIREAKNVVFRQLVLTLVQQEKPDEALRLINGVIRDNPDNWLNQELKGSVLRRIGRMEDAAKVYEKTLEVILKDDRFTKPEREEFAEDVRYALSGVYVDLKKIEKAAEQLKKLLERDPDNATYNNDLGFIWADHNMNLDESEKLIRKALAEDKKQRLKEGKIKPEEYKDNPSYLDSLGWVLYKKKQYADAKKYLLEAVKGEQDEEGNLEIHDHLAEVYLALGDKAEAVKTWKKGLSFASTSKRDKERKVEVEKKIKANE